MMMRWSALIGVAGAVMMSATVASAQYRQDYPGQVNPSYAGPHRGLTIEGAPRPDFPGAKQSETSARHSHKHNGTAAK
jgi:hypothetical protein